MDNNFEKCFFCERYMIPKKPTDKIYKQLSVDKYGYVMKESGHIGNKMMCENCNNDLIELAKPYMDYDS